MDYFGSCSFCPLTVYVNPFPRTPVDATTLQLPHIQSQGWVWNDGVLDTNILFHLGHLNGPREATRYPVSYDSYILYYYLYRAAERFLGAIN